MNEILCLNRITVEKRKTKKSVTVPPAEQPQKSGGFIMKKISVILTAAAITTVLGGTAALAAGNNSRNAYGSGNQETPAYSCTYCEDSSHCFADADGNGICDHFTGSVSQGTSANPSSIPAGNGYGHHSETSACPAGQHHAENNCHSDGGYGHRYHH